MKKIFLIYSLLIASCVAAHSQNLNDAHKAIEAEQYEKARTILENLIKTDSLDGANYFHLGTLYLTLAEDAWALQCFNKGITLKKNGHLNYIGLGQYYLDEKKNAEAEANFARATQNIRKKDAEEWMYIAKAYTKSLNPDYAKAAEYAKKAIAIKSNLAQAYLILGDAEYNLSNASEAYSAYRNAYDLDNTLLRANLHMAVITKNSQAFPEAIKALNDILAANPEYGPAYRELAETYYLWSLIDKSKYNEYISTALAYYKKYMSDTDHSLNSRMRHADFLVLAKDYKELEKEAMEMQKIDNVNPRILRYLGYSAYENGNYHEAIDALTSFITKVDPKRVMALDYTYLGKAYRMLAVADNGNFLDSVSFYKMLTTIKQVNAKEVATDADFSDTGISLYKAKDYYHASLVFEALIANSRCKLLDNLYYANSVLYAAAAKTEEERAAYQAPLHKADSVYAVVIKASPTTQDAYFNRGRLNRFIMGETAAANAADYYEQYLKILEEKGDIENPKDNIKLKLSEANTCIGAACVETDRQKAISCFEKAIAYDPNNEHATQSLKFLKNNK